MKVDFNYVPPHVLHRSKGKRQEINVYSPDNIYDGSQTVLHAYPPSKPPPLLPVKLAGDSDLG